MTTVTSSSLAGAAQSAALANSQAASASGTASSSGTAASTIGNVALQQLAGNFNDFLNLLLTQLQNQDPTSPMDTNSFTTELVQFTGVQQQVATNSSLTALLALNQQQQLLDGAQYVGKSATVTASSISLQNSTGEITFTGTAGETVQIAILNAAGAPIKDATVTATQGTNSWTWDGLDDNGNQVPDGAYSIGVVTGSSGGSTTNVPFDVIGTTTGVSNNGSNGVSLQLGSLSVGLSNVVSIGN
jgi:flagellar basal-body rod modification protein FlgD